MNKIILIVLFFVTNIVTLANEAVMDVTAKIVENITVTTKDIDFGKIIRGREKKEPDTPGEIIVNGEPNSIVSLVLQGNGEKIRDKMELYPNGVKGKGENLVYKVKLFKKNGEEIFLDSEGQIALNLSNLGDEKINLKGNIKAPDKIELGNYEGNISIRVKYLK